MPPATRMHLCWFSDADPRDILPPKSPDCPETPQFPQPFPPKETSTYRKGSLKLQVCWFQKLHPFQLSARFQNLSFHLGSPKTKKLISSICLCSVEPWALEEVDLPKMQERNRKSLAIGMLGIMSEWRGNDLSEDLENMWGTIPTIQHFQFVLNWLFGFKLAKLTKHGLHQIFTTHTWCFLQNFSWDTGSSPIDATWTQRNSCAWRHCRHWCVGVNILHPRIVSRQPLHFVLGWRSPGPAGGDRSAWWATQGVFL